MANLFLALLFGAFVGWIANKFMGKSDGLIGTIVLGLLGSLVGNTLYVLIVTGNLNTVFSRSFEIVNLIIAVVGAIITSFIFEKLRK